jgi:hypothetical protein
MPFDPRDPTVNFAGTPTTVRGYQPPQAGANSAAEYMASGLPYSKEVVAGTTTPDQTDFPFVTNEIYIKNRGPGPIDFGWTSNGVKTGTNRHRLFVSESVTLRVRVKSIFFLGVSGSATADLTAALTMIKKVNFSVLTGSAANPDTGGFGFSSGSTESIWGYDGIG